MIYHIALASDWHDARQAGEYRISTRGRTLEEEGFVHCSRAHQVAQVASRFYPGLSGLVLLTIDPARLTSEVRYESVPGSDEPYPHVYGPINLDAVVQVEPFDPPTLG